VRFRDVGRRGSAPGVRMLGLLQPDPIIVDVGSQAAATPDISVDFVLGMFEMAGIFLLAAALGSALVAGCVLLVKRRRQRLAPSGPDHTTLGLS